MWYKQSLICEAFLCVEIEFPFSIKMGKGDFFFFWGPAEGTSRGKGRPRLKWKSIINRDMTLLDLTKQMTLDRTEWRRRIHVADPI